MNFGDIGNISLTADFLLRIVQLAIEAGFLKSNSSGNGTASGIVYDRGNGAV